MMRVQQAGGFGGVTCVYELHVCTWTLTGICVHEADCMWVHGRCDRRVDLVGVTWVYELHERVGCVLGIVTGMCMWLV